MIISTLWFQSRPHGINRGAPGLLLFLLILRVPGADTEKAEQIHIVNLSHPPPAFQQIVVCGINEFRQRQDSAMGVTGSTVGVFSSAAFVGNSSKISVV